MANGLQWIIREAKHLRRKDRNRREWRDYIKQASAIYARKHKGRSPVGKPRKKMKRHARPGRVRRRRVVRGLSTNSKSHVDKNRFKSVNVQIGKVTAGSLTAELRRRIKQHIDRAVVSRYHASTKRDKRRFTKRITEAKRKLKKLT